MFTKTTLFHKPNEGGGSGGDQHNLGWYATPEALRTAHATATAGDWAIVGSTDTVWIWDTDTSAWKDSDQKGQVTSVNGQTGDVTVGGLPDQTDQSGKFLTTDGTDASWSDKPFVNNSIDSTSIVVLGSSNNEQVGRSRQRIVIGYGAVVSGASNSNDIVIGNSARSSINTEGSNIVIGPAAVGAGGESIAIGYGSSVKSRYSISIGRSADIGGSRTYKGNIAIGYYAAIGNAHGAIQFNNGTNNESGTMCVALSTDGSTWNNYKLLDSDGTIPEDRLADTTNATAGQVLTLDSNLNVVWATGGSGGSISDVTVNGTSVVSGGVAAITCATIDDTSTSSSTATWSASKLNTTIGDIETLINAL